MSVLAHSQPFCRQADMRAELLRITSGGSLFMVFSISCTPSSSKRSVSHQKLSCRIMQGPVARPAVYPSSAGDPKAMRAHQAKTLGSVSPRPLTWIAHNSAAEKQRLSSVHP